MENFKNVQEKIICKANLIEKTRIKSFCNKYNDSLLKKAKIPKIIDLKKTYETFSWVAKEDSLKDKDLTHKVLVLLSKQCSAEDTLVYIEISMNMCFYSHTELIKMLTPINVEFSAYEIIGDIIHLNLTDNQLKYKSIIGDVIHFKTGKTVINKTGQIDNTYRNYQCEVLAGPSSLTTVHNENGVKIFLDLGKVYWCSRLQYQRSRILTMIKEGDVVCDPFCGVGPHIIPAIKKGATALCNDLNKAAIDCLKKSLALNKIQCNVVESIDAGVFLEKHKKAHIDHFIFNLPEHSLEYLKYTESYEGNFFLHVFFFCKTSVEVCDYFAEVTNYKAKKEWLIDVRKVSPSKCVYKLEVKSRDFFSYQI